MNQQNNIRVFDTPADLDQAADLFIMELANKTVATKGRFVIALSGGHTPEHIYKLLSDSPFRNAFPWKKTFVFWGDERYVPMDNKDNNAHMAKTMLLNHVDIPVSNIYPILTNLSPDMAATAYENTITEFFNNEPPVFDLILLGLGENGHTASLFPNTPVLHEKEHLVKEVLAGKDNYRITMTAPLINHANNVLFLIEGAGKAAILKTVLEGAHEPEKYPAQLIKPVNGELRWFVDKKAAALLSQ